MRSSSNSRKGQFFILSAVAIVTILFFVSRWLEPLSLTDTSAVVLSEEAFTFNNIQEKASVAVEGSENCDDLNYNLQEYKNFIADFAREKNYRIDLDYSSTPCDEELGSVTEFRLRIISEKVDAKGTFYVTWP